MLRPDTVTMLTSYGRVAGDVFQQGLRDVADLEDTHDSGGGTPDDKLAAAGDGGRGLGGQETFDPGRVHERHGGDVHDHLGRALLQDLGQEIAQRIGARDVDLAPENEDDFVGRTTD